MVDALRLSTLLLSKTAAALVAQSLVLAPQSCVLSTVCRAE